MTAVILFVFGAIVGSFLNVFALRLHSGRSLGGRSACSRCGAPLLWWELVPILSFIMLRGRCRHCRTAIPRQYPLVEAFTGLVFATMPLLLLPVFCLYIAILIYDIRHKIIPDRWVYTSIVLAIVLGLFSPHTLLDWLAGPILFIFFAAIWLLSQGRAMGFGDAKLALSMGLLLGAAEGFSAVIFGFWIGAAYGIFLLLKRGNNITMKSELPFAPFLILGAWLAALLHADLLHVTTLL